MVNKHVYLDTLEWVLLAIYRYVIRIPNCQLLQQTSCSVKDHLKNACDDKCVKHVYLDFLVWILARYRCDFCQKHFLTCQLLQQTVFFEESSWGMVMLISVKRVYLDILDVFVISLVKTFSKMPKIDRLL